MKANPSFLERYRFLDRRLPRLYAWFVIACAAIIAAAALWASLGQFDVVVKSRSVIRPFANVSTIKNATPGMIKARRFSNGDRVQAGSVLWTIDTAAAEIDLSNSREQLRRLGADLEQLSLYADSLETGKNVIPPGFPEAFNKAEAYFSDTARLRLLVSSKKEKWTLESQLPPSLTLVQKVKDLKSDWLLSELELSRLQAAEKERVYSDRKSLLTSIETLRQKQAQLMGQIRDAQVRAPISGVIEDLKKFNENDFLLAGEEPARIIPGEDESLKLELRVDTQDIAEIKLGQEVTSLFPGLPPSLYGKVLARVTNVPADSIVVNGQIAFFLVEATLDRPWVADRKGVRIALKPGMNASSRIIVTRKTIMKYLLEKLEFID